MPSVRRLAAVAKKEMREILRDPITLGIALILPLIMMFLFSYAITLDVKDIALAVVDEDNSPERRVASISPAFCTPGIFACGRLLKMSSRSQISWIVGLCAWR